jgi:hypothetical protein
MPTVFDLLEDIEKRPGIYLGWTPKQRGKQLHSLEGILVGYSHAVNRHGIDEPGRNFCQSFGHFLRMRYGWAEAEELGPIAEIRRRAASDEEAWQMVWKLIRVFLSTISERPHDDGAPHEGS